MLIFTSTGLINEAQAHLTIFHLTEALSFHVHSLGYALCMLEEEKPFINRAFVLHRRECSVVGVLHMGKFVLLLSCLKTNKQ